MRTHEGEVDDFFVESDRLEDLRTAITLKSRDAHLREDLEKTQIDRLQIIFFCRGRVQIGRNIGRIVDQLTHRLEGQIGIDATSAIANEQREMRDLPSLTGLDD